MEYTGIVSNKINTKAIERIIIQHKKESDWWFYYIIIFCIICGIILFIVTIVDIYG